MNTQVTIYTQLKALAVAGRTNDFGTALVANFERYGRWSDKQQYWANKLCAEATTPAGQPANVIDVAPLFAMMATAQAALKRPSIRLQAADGSVWSVRPAGETSANAGQLYLYDGVTKAYAGKISPQGELRCRREVTTPGQVHEAVKGFCKDPQGAAKAYGFSTKTCCFCAKALSDAFSVENGYGPVCAKRFGLVHKAAGQPQAAVMDTAGTVTKISLVDLVKALPFGSGPGTDNSFDNGSQ
jgi:hypothetical protein